MNMLFSISWRNIWRHPGRSSVVIAAITVGLWAGIVISSWTNGLIDQRFNNLIQEEVTHLQVHHPDFLSEREPGMILQGVNEIFDHLDGDERVRQFTGRTIVDGMVQSALTTSGVQVRGVIPDRERETTTFHENLVDGDYLDSDLRHPVIIGRRLADKLNVDIGTRIVLSFQDLDNELTSGAFHVAGIFRSGNSSYDERNVFVRADDLGELISGESVYHEIAVMLHNEANSEEVARDLGTQFEHVSAQTWYELSPELRFLTDTGAQFFFYVMVVIMLALAFGILNTMLMAIFERMREIGMLLAIGMTKARVFTMIMLESVLLTMIGALLGMGLAWLTVGYLETHGLDLTAVGGDTLEEFGYDALVYPFVTAEEYLSLTLLVIATALLAAIYPAWKALRLNPADVVREK